jgi:hypothetical protein
MDILLSVSVSLFGVGGLRSQRAREAYPLIPRGCTPNLQIVGLVPHSSFYRVDDCFVGTRMSSARQKCLRWTWHSAEFHLIAPLDYSTPLARRSFISAAARPSRPKISALCWLSLGATVRTRTLSPISIGVRRRRTSPNSASLAYCTRLRCRLWPAVRGSEERTSVSRARPSISLASAPDRPTMWPPSFASHCRDGPSP